MILGSRLTLQQAADQMGITRKTANLHKCRMMYRLSLSSRNELKDNVGQSRAEPSDLSEH